MPKSPLFIETFAIRDGAICNFSLHMDRILSTLRHHNIKNDFWLRFSEKELRLPKQQGVYKGRMIYGETLHEFSSAPYIAKNVKSLQMVEADHINYAYKYADRSPLNLLLEQCKKADDILIIKNGLVTDTGYTNVLFFDTETYYTPTSYLLNGTQRRFLLSKRLIKERKISSEDVFHFSSIFLINALLDWEHKIEIPITSIVPPVRLFGE